MVYNTNSVMLTGLNKGVTYYSVDSFNESGITKAQNSTEIEKQESLKRFK